MRASTLFVLTFLIWLTAKGRLNKYWELATTNATDLEGSGAGLEGGSDHASPSSSLNIQAITDYLNGEGPNGGGGW